MMKKRTGWWIPAVLIIFTLVFSLTPNETAYAASSPNVTIWVTYDKVDAKNTTETIKLKIKNRSAKKLTFLAYQECGFNNWDEGGILTYRTKNKKNVTIKPGKTKTITMITHQGYISFDKPEDGTDMWVMPSVKYSGKYYRGQFTANKGLNKKLTDGYFNQNTAANYKALKDSWTE